MKALALAALHLLTLAVFAEETSPAPMPAKAGPAVFQRIFLIGASLTAGFNSAEPFGGPKTPQYRFANYIESALKTEHNPVGTYANALVFLDPTESASKQIVQLQEAKPSLVIGLDAMFWFCYGKLKPTDQDRQTRFEDGLKFLSQIEVPMVIGDVPYAEKAVGGILGKEEVPDTAVIEKCNARLKQWAAARGNVAIFPLAQLMSAAMQDEECEIAGLKWEKGKSRALLQRDSLHPSRHGLAALAIAVLDSARSLSSTPIDQSSVSRDLETVYTAGVEKGTPAPAPAAPSGTN